MVRKLRPRSAYDVMAAIAFFIAVAGGSAYAAATIGSGKIKNDAVLSRHIKNGEVKNPDLAANSVGSGKVINNSLTGADIKAATLGQVPSAGHAGTAAQATSTAHANNSDRLGDSLPSAFFPAANVTKIDKDAAGCTTAADPGCSPTALDLGEFKVSYTCNLASVAQPHMRLAVDATGPNANVNWFYSVTPSGGTAAVTDAGSGGGTDIEVFALTPPTGHSDHVVGTIIYRADGQVVTISFTAFLVGRMSGGECILVGTSTKATG